MQEQRTTLLRNALPAPQVDQEYMDRLQYDSDSESPIFARSPVFTPSPRRSRSPALRIRAQRRSRSNVTARAAPRPRVVSAVAVKTASARGVYDFLPRRGLASALPPPSLDTVLTLSNSLAPRVAVPVIAGGDLPPQPSTWIGPQRKESSIVEPRARLHLRPQSPTNNSSTSRALVFSPESRVDPESGSCKPHATKDLLTNTSIELVCSPKQPCRPAVAPLVAADDTSVDSCPRVEVGEARLAASRAHTNVDSSATSPELVCSLKQPCTPAVAPLVAASDTSADSCPRDEVGEARLAASRAHTNVDSSATSPELVCSLKQPCTPAVAPLVAASDTSADSCPRDEVGEARSAASRAHTNVDSSATSAAISDNRGTAAVDLQSTALGGFCHVGLRSPLANTRADVTELAHRHIFFS
jgi:hypothetical protein